MLLQLNQNTTLTKIILICTSLIYSIGLCYFFTENKFLFPFIKDFVTLSTVSCLFLVFSSKLLWIISLFVSLLYFTTISWIFYNGWNTNFYLIEVIQNSSFNEQLTFLLTFLTSSVFYKFLLYFVSPAFILITLLIYIEKKYPLLISKNQKILWSFFLSEMLIILYMLPVPYYGESFFPKKNNPYQKANYTFLTEQADKDLIVVFMLGESVRGDHLNLNGYSRETMPLISKEKNIISFKNAHASRLDTVSNFKCLMSAYDSTISFYDIPIRESMFSVFNQLNFKTALFSTNDITETYNLYKPDLQNTHMQIIADYDEKLLALMEQFIQKNQNQKQFIMLHTYGSHHRYQNVIPKDKKYHIFNKINSPTLISSNSCNCAWSLHNFNLDKVINDYDNTLIYLDYVMHTLIQKLEDKNAIFIYTSDHGESFGENGQTCLHCFPEKEVWHVPLIIWASDSWINKNPQKWNNIQAAFNQEKQNQRNVSHRNIVPSLLDCSNIKTDFFDKKYSFCQKEFIPDFFEGCNRFQKNDCPTCNSFSNLIIQNIPSQIKKINPILNKTTCIFDKKKEKTFLHAMNSAHKLKSHLFEFSNFEIDIFYKNNKILTGHNPQGMPEGELSDIFKIFPDTAHYHFWLDVKNLTVENAPKLIKNLNLLLKKYNISKNQILIESPNTEALSLFSKDGFETTLYFLPLSDNISRQYDSIQTMIKEFQKYPTNYISADVKYASYLQYFFPNICHLFWNVPEHKSQSILKFEQTKAIIIDRH